MERGDRGTRLSEYERSSRRPTGGASFMVRSGHASVAVRCDAGESMRACVDATLVLLEPVRSGISSQLFSPLLQSGRPEAHPAYRRSPRVRRRVELCR